MILFQFFLIIDPRLINTVTLQTANQMLLEIRPSAMHIASDGTIVVGAGYSVWPFNADGSLKLKFGRRGEGPNEYEHVWAVHFDGEHYWIADGRRLNTTKVDANGKYVNRYQFFFNALWGHQGIMYYQYAGGFKQLQRERKTIIGEIEVVRGALGCQNES